MKEFLARQAIKIMCSVILIPVTRFVLMPALLGQLPQLPEGVSPGNIPLRDSGGAQISENKSFTGGLQMSGDVQKQMQEAVRRTSIDLANNSGRTKTTSGVSTSENKTDSPTPSKTDKANQQTRIAEVQGHKILINPAKTSVNSVVIQPGSNSQPAKCQPGKS